MGGAGRERKRDKKDKKKNLFSAPFIMYVCVLLCGNGEYYFLLSLFEVIIYSEFNQPLTSKHLTLFREITVCIIRIIIINVRVGGVSHHS